MKKLFLMLVSVLLVSALILGGCAEPAPAPAPAPSPAPAPAPAPAPVVLKMALFTPDIWPGNVWPHMLADKVNSRSNGQLIIEIAGGPEVVDPFEAPRAVARGAIDMCSGFISEVDPPANSIECIQHAYVTVEEYRQNGAFDLANELYSKIGLRYLGLSTASPKQNETSFFSKKKIASITDFKGLKFAIPGKSYVAFLEALEIMPVSVPFPDYFTAMERGTIDGYNLGPPGVIDFSLQDVTPYMIDELYGSSGAGFLLNLEKWNMLSSDLQDIVTQAAIETEGQDGLNAWKDIDTQLRQKLAEAGMEFIKFSPEDSKKFHDIYKESLWNAMLEQYPEYGPKWKALLAPQ